MLAHNVINNLPDNVAGSRQAVSLAWRALAYFNVYRFLISFLFISLYWFEQSPLPLGIYNGPLFRSAALLYLLLALVFVLFIHLQWPGYLFQVIMQAIADILILTALMYACGGLDSGFAVLLVIAVAGGGALLPASQRIGFFFAAVATLCVFAQEFYLQLNWEYYDPDHAQVGFLGIAFFVTAFISYTLADRLRQSEELASRQAIDLAKASSLNAQIVQRLQAGILVLDDDLTIQLANAAAERLLGLNRDGEKGSLGGMDKNLAAVAPALAARVEQWRAGGEASVIFKAAGVDVQASFSRMMLAAATELLIFLEDASSLKQRAQQLKLASLGRLTASIAHEVRNPLGAISHAGQLLSESAAFGAEDARLVNIIVGHSRRVSGIIENVLNISRRDPAGGDAIGQNRGAQAIGLGEWTLRFAEEFRQRRRLAEADVQVQKSGDITVQVDPQQLHQIVWNLCENGIRYSRHAPLLTLRCGVQADTGRAFLDIIDTGPGISTADQERLFEPFFTTSNSGSGLGLYIARELAELNQAGLSLASDRRQDHAHVHVQDRDRQQQAEPSGCCFRLTFAAPGQATAPA